MGALLLHFSSDMEQEVEPMNLESSTEGLLDIAEVFPGDSAPIKFIVIIHSTYRKHAAKQEDRLPSYFVLKKSLYLFVILLET